MNWINRALVSVFLLGTVSVTHADDIQVYFNHPVNPPALQSNLEHRIIDVIDSAQSQLWMAIYDLDLPGIAYAMRDAKARGVDVRFITDEDNVGHVNAEALGILDAANIPWIDDTANGSAGSKIQHNKFIIVDGHTLLTGSTNFTQSGIHGDLNMDGVITNEGNDNHIVVIKSQQLANLYAWQFSVMWGDGPGGALDSLFGLGKPDHSVETVYTDNDNIRLDVQFTPQSPTVMAGSSLETMINYVTTAQQRIYLAQFVISAQDIADAMEKRFNAGVEVKGLGDSSFFYRYFSEFQDMLGVAKLNNNGVYETDSFTGAPNNPWSTPADVRVANMAGGDKFHHKYIIVDDTVLTGSHNASGAAAFGNDENLIIIHDAQTTAEFVGHFDRAFCEAGYQSNCGNSGYQGGTWEGVSFTAKEVAQTLDLANNASLTELDVDAAMNKRAATNIVNARPITSMDQLEAVPYVGNAAMTQLKAYLPTWTQP